MRNVKKILALLLAVLMLLSLAACGKDTEPTTEPTEAPEASGDLTMLENTYFTVGYSESEGWTLTEDSYYIYGEGGNADICIMNSDGYADITVSIRANAEGPADFREAMYENGIDMQAYAAGQVETTDVGGQPMLYVDKDNGTRFFFGRNEAAGVTYTISAENWEDARVPALVGQITCTASATDNVDPPWPWAGEAFTGGTVSQTVGSTTVTAQFLPMAEPLTTFETFKHDLEVIGDKVYLLSDHSLYEYAYDGAGLTKNKDIPLDEEYEYVESADGAMILSSFMRDVLRHDGTSVLASYEGPDKFAVAPDGTWGISWFTAGDDTMKYTFQGDALVGEEMPFAEVDTISHLCIDDTYIYISGSPVGGDDHTVFVYDHAGTLQLKLLGEPGDSSIGLGSVSFMAKTAGGFIAMDANMRDVVLWAADGTWLGTVEDGDLFGTYYPWFAAGETLDDGSIIVAMTEDRNDESATEVLLFKITVS